MSCRDIEKSHERVLLVKGWKQFDVIAEIASLDLSLRSIENKYICRNCVAKLKKRRGLLEQVEKVSLALKRSGELLIGDQDGPTSKKVCEGSDMRGFPFRLPRLFVMSEERDSDSNQHLFEAFTIKMLLQDSVESKHSGEP